MMTYNQVPDSSNSFLLDLERRPNHSASTLFCPIIRLARLKRSRYSASSEKTAERLMQLDIMCLPCSISSEKKVALACDVSCPFWAPYQRSLIEMRLINVYTLNIESFEESDQKYAILSHRWSKNEVKYSEYASVKSQIAHQLSGDGDGNTGIGKIAGACLQCQALGLQYLWIDTCCIDKMSSAEEIESINSMFNWYKEAEICLAYLADVGEAPYQSFSESVWFTRGWTLQELLASRNVTFFDRYWHELGTKTSLSSDIEKATRISHKHLEDFRSASIATRMSWQAGRTTSRTEDLAYSMFGIFDVGMDVRYGEREKAFRRLQVEIINHYPLDESILAWQAPGAGKRGGVLASHPSCFKDSAHFTVASPVHKYQPRVVYQTTNRGLEISASFIKSKFSYLFNREVLKSKLEEVDLTLNCWDEGKPSPATVVLHLVRDERGFFHRTNCDQLDWAKVVSRSRFKHGMDLTDPIPVNL